ncbi:MAG: hypothetical protein ABFQ95_03675 [Pseudomonadota bacterium]
MVTPAEKLADSLKILDGLQNQGIFAFRASDISRVHRARLIQNGFLTEVIKGWYISSRPDEQPGDSTAWYSLFWNFCSRYLQERFGTIPVLNQNVEFYGSEKRAVYLGK